MILIKMPNSTEMNYIFEECHMSFVIKNVLFYMERGRIVLGLPPSMRQNKGHPFAQMGFSNTSYEIDFIIITNCIINSAKYLLLIQIWPL